MGALHQALTMLHSPAPSGGGGCNTAAVSSGLRLWLDPRALGLTDNDQIDTWQDCSGNGNDATGVLVNTVKPLYRATDGPNSTPAVRLVNSANSQGGYFTLPNAFSGLTEAHILALVKMDFAGGSDAPIFSDFGSDLSGDIYAFSDNRIFSAFGSTARKDCGNGYLATHSILTWHLAEARSAAGAWSFWIDGDQIFSTGTNTVGWGSSPFIGHRTAGGANSRSEMSELYLYDHVLSGGDYTTFKNDISTRYLLTLA